MIKHLVSLWMFHILDSFLQWKILLQVMKQSWMLERIVTLIRPLATITWTKPKGRWTFFLRWHCCLNNYTKNEGGRQPESNNDAFLINKSTFEINVILALHSQLKVLSNKCYPTVWKDPALIAARKI